MIVSSRRIRGSAPKNRELEENAQFIPIRLGGQDTFLAPVKNENIDQSAQKN
jgi:hypothetical protein